MKPNFVRLEFRIYARKDEYKSSTTSDFDVTIPFVAIDAIDTSVIVKKLLEDAIDKYETASKKEEAEEAA